MTSFPFSITLNLLLLAELVVEALLETFDEEDDFFFLFCFFSFLALSLFFSLTFSLEKVLHLLLYLGPCQLVLQMSLQLYNFLSVLFPQGK